jgi:uncharacterized repeat protein (TIGR02543 family)
MKTTLFPPRISRLFFAGFGFLLLLAALVLTACASPIDPGPDSYIVSFNNNGGDTQASPQTIQVVSPATTVGTLPAAPSRADYIFTGWNTRANGTGSPFMANTLVTADITVYAQWYEPPPPGTTYTVSFNNNGGDTQANPQTIQVVSPAVTVGTLPAAPARTGYTFASWNTLPDGTGTTFTADTLVRGDITVYALWRAIAPGTTYTVTFNNNGGDTQAYPQTIAVVFPAVTVGTLPTPPTKASHTFTGWNTLADGTGTSFTELSPVRANITVFAQWHELPPPGTTYTVTFNNNGGDTQASPQTKTVVSPATTVGTLPAAPARAGYTFASWNTKADGTGTTFRADTPVTTNITVFAQWHEQPPPGTTYTVTFNHNGGDTQASPRTIAVVSPATTVVTLPTPPTRAGHTFVSWNTLADGTGTPFTADTPVGTDITVFALWNVIPPPAYTVIFNNNGGDTQASPQTKTVVSPATTVGTLPTPPAKAGYTFASWNTLVDGTGTTFREDTPVTTNITVYAQWHELPPPGTTYTVTFDNNGGDTEADPQTITVVSPATTVETLPVPPTKAGYYLASWNTEVDGTGTPFREDTPVTTDITVYAQWNVIPPAYTVTFNNNGGNTQANPQTIAVVFPATTVVTLPTPPTRAGHTFASWNTLVNGTGDTFRADTPVTTNITVFAKWTPDYTYTVTFNNNGGETQAAPRTIAVVSPATTVVTLPTPPAKAGHTLASWKTLANGTGTTFRADTPVTTSITVFAKWNVISPAYTYTVSFDNNGGDTQAAPQTIPVVSPATTVVTLPTPPAKAGHTFDSWNTLADGSGDTFMADTTVTAGITVYAQWNVLPPSGTTITLRFDDPGTDAFNQPVFTVVRGGSPASQSQTIALDGWSSGEWRVDGRGRGSAASFIVNAADYTVGGHTLEVVVLDGTVPWSKTLGFTVAQAVTGISLNKNSLTLPEGGSEILFATVSPANAANKTVSWSSNNPLVAAVDPSTGLVSAVATGTVTITATSQDGEHTATCTVTVLPARTIKLSFSDPGSTAFNQSAFEVVRGGSSASQTITLVGGTLTSPEWRVDGKVRGSATNSFTVNAADYTLGGHTLEVVGNSAGKPWSKTLQFTVSR